MQYDENKLWCWQGYRMALKGLPFNAILYSLVYNR